MIFHLANTLILENVVHFLNVNHIIIRMVHSMVDHKKISNSFHITSKVSIIHFEVVNNLKDFNFHMEMVDIDLV